MKSNILETRIKNERINSPFDFIKKTDFENEGVYFLRIHVWLI